MISLYLQKNAACSMTVHKEAQEEKNYLLKRFYPRKI